METRISMMSIRDLLDDMASDRVRLLDERKQVDVTVGAAIAVLDALQRGAPLGMLTITEHWADNLPMKVIADGAVRMAVLAGAFLPSTSRPAWAPDWLANYAYTGLGTDRVGVGLVDPDDPRQLPTQAMLRTRDFMVWERRLGTIASTDMLGGILKAAHDLTATIYAIMPAAVVAGGSPEELRQTAAQANARLP
ncbi:hypothetical protein JNW90_01300 [Micromonospora sp. STR1s_5]|nr:hypothetical protein [Micromonospora sp. STR1s_5]